MGKYDAEHFDIRAAGELEGARPASNLIYRRRKPLKSQAFQWLADCEAIILATANLVKSRKAF